jgi:hypothetical protein
MSKTFMSRSPNWYIWARAYCLPPRAKPTPRLLQQAPEWQKYLARLFLEKEKREIKMMSCGDSEWARRVCVWRHQYKPELLTRLKGVYTMEATGVLTINAPSSPHHGDPGRFELWLLKGVYMSGKVHTRLRIVEWRVSMGSDTEALTCGLQPANSYGQVTDGG